jgi:hypothetical protein
MLTRYSCLVALLMLLVAPVRAIDFMGTVVDGADRPLRDVKVWAVALSEKSSARKIPYRPLLTDAQGKFSLPIPAGEKPQVYIDIVAAPGMAPQYPKSTVVGTSWKIMLKRVGGLRQSGRVVDKDGNPLAGVRVRAVQKDLAGSSTPLPALPLLPDGSGAFEAVTDASGVWTHTDLGGYGYSWVIADPRYLAGSPVSARRAASVEDMVARPAIQFTGRIVDEEGRPREGVMVVALMPYGGVKSSPRAQALSQRDGTFVLGGLTGGFWFVTALVAEGDAVAETRAVYIWGTMSQEIGTLMLQPGVLVEGRVVDKETGQGVPNITIREMGRPEAFLTTRTDAEGRWFWRTLPGPAILLLTGAYPRFRAAEPLSFTVPAGERFAAPLVELILRD